jgi:hypothetical protein
MQEALPRIAELVDGKRYSEAFARPSCHRPTTATDVTAG